MKYFQALNEQVIEFFQVMAYRNWRRRAVYLQIVFVMPSNFLPSRWIEGG